MSSSSPPSGGWRRLLLSLLWCVCSACPGAPAVFPLRVMQLAAFLGFHTWLTHVGCPTPAVMVSRGVGVFFLMPAQLPLPLLPLRGSAPLTGELACLTPACWSTPGVGLEGSCCATWFAPMCCTLPQGLQRALLSLLQVTFGFSSHRGSVLLLPW